MGHGCTQIHAMMNKPSNWNMVSTKSAAPQKYSQKSFNFEKQHMEKTSAAAETLI